MKTPAICTLMLSAMMATSAYGDSVSLTLNFDAYPADISFQMRQDGEAVAFDAAASSTQGTTDSGGFHGSFSDAELADQSIEFVWDLASGEYEFVIQDAYGDGLCCNEGGGSYAIISSAGVLYQSSGSFGSGETATFEVGAPPVTHSYALNGTLGDSIGALPLESNGGFFENGRYHFENGQGLTLRDGLTNVDEYSIEIALRLDSAQGAFVKLLDFLDLTSDNGVYWFNEAFIFYNQTLASSRNIALGEDFVFVITQDSGGETRGYVDGELQFTLGGGSNASAPDNVINIMADDLITLQGETGAGSIDYVRVYDGALSGDDIAALVPPLPDMLGDTISSYLSIGTNSINWWNQSNAPLAAAVVSPGAEYPSSNIPTYDVTANFEQNRLTITLDGTSTLAVAGPNLIFDDLDFESGLVELQVVSNNFPGTLLALDVTSPTSINVAFAPIQNLTPDSSFEMVLDLITVRTNDTDGDGFGAAVDNCLDTANPDQFDSDGDGFGNACDADLNNDCVVNALDLGLLRLAFFSTPTTDGWNPDADFNNDGVVNAQDLGALRLQFFGTPGPAAGATCNL